MNILDAEYIQGFIRLTDDAFRKGWHERNGGNLSYRIKQEEVEAVKDNFHAITEWKPIGNTVPGVAGEYFLVTGSGKYMRNVILAPEDNITIIKIDDKGENYGILWGLAHGGRPTSELPTHLAAHALRKKLSKGTNRIIYHAHPTNLIALTFVLPLEDKAFTRELWEMATEDPVIFPEGLGVVPWMVPGGKAIADATVKLMETYRAVVWAHHGLFVCGDDFDEAFGLMDTVEKASSICVKVLAMGGKKQTISKEGFIQLAKDFHIELNTTLLED
jgi:rhamnulose-1-phosphate aldolase